MAATQQDARAAVLRAQAAYYLLTGIWPLIDMRTFQAATGPKLEHWLVKTVGLAVSVTGASLWAAAQRDAGEQEPVVVLGTGTAAVLGAVDVYYVARRRISPAYLVDAVAQAAILAAWARTGRKGGPVRG